MFFVVTMYKGADGAFERKEYSLKAQSRVTKGRPDTGVAAAIAKLSTFAKTTFDLAPTPPSSTAPRAPRWYSSSTPRGVSSKGLRRGVHQRHLAQEPHPRRGRHDGSLPA